MTTWDETSARSWLSSSWTPMALAVKAVGTALRSDSAVAASAAPAGEIRSPRSEPAPVLADTLRTCEREPELRLMFGHASARSALRLACHTSGPSMPSMALSTRVCGPPQGYLGVTPTAEQILMFAALNGLDVPLVLRR